ncbi:hypothetical protein C5Z25_03630 [Lactobacillus sp. CBA3605]|uniref:hypothetical protein n=1 Tax=Lactobacillus sp. CBA3605 TaxID=2099788 RepID=UPI000CFD5651|nr:hypothetical protein [Lactobacillus sp. CBA3605]AVK60898.1 hypothetical protein C5Z25_03630 [Lactobacillus sp. CBA3605]
MRKYGIQVLLYSQYFLKVMLANLTVLTYTVLVPIILFALNTRGEWFKALTLAQFTTTVMPFVAWMIFSNTLIVIADIAMLREQGYLKQYQALVVKPSVFIVSKALINLLLLGVVLTLVGLGGGLFFKLAPFTIIWRLWVVLLIVYLPIVSGCLPLLSWALRYKTINAIMNLVMLGLAIGSAWLVATFSISLNNIWMNLVNPIFFVTNSFSVLVSGHWMQFLPTYVSVLVVSLLIGHFSYRRFKLLPTEAL